MSPRHPARRVLNVPRYAQPDDVSCGPTCLAQVLAWYGDHRPIPALMARTPTTPDGGTLAVHLGQVALDLGYRARLHPFGARVFDPTWWELEDEEIALRLAQRAEGLQSPTARAEVEAWLRFLVSGGYIDFHEPSAKVLVRILSKGRPIICGLNATWLYREARTNPVTNADDDVHGHPMGHFVTVVGYTGRGLHFHVNDPSEEASVAVTGNSAHEDPGRYPLRSDRLIHAILLGDATSDAVLLEIWPPHAGQPGPPEAP